MVSSLNLLIVSIIIVIKVYGSYGGLTDHVCAVQKKDTISYVRYLTRIGYDNYRTCCKRAWRACLDRCTRYRSKTVRYSKKDWRVITRTVYECCKGWAPNGNRCIIPICNPRCQNGKCVAPNQCQCYSGFQGRYCEQDIDECQSKPCSQICTNVRGSYTCSCNKGFVKTNPTEHRDARCTDVNECSTLKPCKCASTIGGCKAICVNKPGSYHCACQPGYALLFDGKTCTDVDECQSHPCQQKCQNLPGSYKCSCNAGFQKTVGDPKDARCSNINECNKLNGGCNQICIDKVGSYACTCRPGYQLSYNRKTCLDVNECESRPCSQVCQNLQGTYKCMCKPGYKKVNSDPKDARCVDVDECKTTGLNRCSQNCQNNDGSYTCSCNTGYRLNKNKYSCDDINECTENKHNCQQNCNNNVGSFTCSCRPGYKLAADKKTCTAQPCETITKPLNGKMTCNGYVTGKTCNFACDEGFDLIGDSKRICQATGTWTGKYPTCKRKVCPEIKVPLHGSVLEPCIKFYGSTCLLKCSAGFHLNGNQSSICKVNDGKTKWFPDNAVCKASTICTPNPCQNLGVCKQDSYSTFSCDCSGTSYTGKTCNIGLVSVPNFPQLVVNEVSETLYFYAKPKEVMQVQPIYDKTSLKFEPERINIYASTGEASFEVTALKSGSFKVDFGLIGMDARNFVKPKSVMIYSTDKKIITKPIDLPANFMKGNCKDIPLGYCKGSVKISSSCNWDKGTNGFVSAKTSKLNIPISIVGMFEETLVDFNIKKVINPTNELKQYFQKRTLTGSCSTSMQCPNINYDNNAAYFITNNNVFQRGYIDELNKVLPSFINMNVDSKERYFSSNNFVSFIGQENAIKKTSPCNRLDSNVNDLYAIYLPKSILQFYFGSSLTFTSNSEEASCVSVNLCSNGVSIALHEKNYIGFRKDLSQLGLADMQLTLKGFSYGNVQNLCLSTEGKPKCSTVNSYVDVSLTTSMNQKKTYFSFNGKIYSTIDDKFVAEKFNKQRALSMKGETFYKMKLKLLGSYINIRGKSKETEIHATIGGATDCPICMDKGAKLSLRNHQTQFEYSYNILKFKVKSKFNVYIPFNFNGGSVKTIDSTSKSRVDLNVRSLKKNMPVQLTRLYQAIKSSSIETSVIKKYEGLFNKALTDFEASLKQTKFVEIQKKLLMLKSATDDFKAQLFGTSERNGKNMRVKIMSKFVLNQLRSIGNLNIFTSSEKISTKEQGQIISFEGSFCLYSLCFDDVGIKIYDIEYSSCNKDCQKKFSSYISKDSTVIVLNVLKDSLLSNRIKLAKGTTMKFIIKKESYGIDVSFSPFIKYLNSFEKANLSINKDEVKIALNNVPMVGKQVFLLKATTQLKQATWKNIFSKINGVSYTMAKDVMKYAQNDYLNIATKTNQRLKVSNERIKIAEKNLAIGKEKFKTVEKQLKQSQTTLSLEQQRYKIYVLEQYRNQTKFDAQLKKIDPLFIEQNLEKVCKTQKCRQVCIPMPVCETCQDPLIIDVPSLKCEAKTENIKVNLMLPQKRTCPVRMYHFQPIYTGSCAPDPSEQKAADKKVQTSLIMAGAAIGSVIPGVGTAVGAAVGAVVGAVIGGIIGMFSSCDKSMEVVKTSWVEEFSCIRLEPGIRTITRPFSECYDIKVKTQTGFKVPYTCKCQINDCVAKGPEPACLEKNQLCEDQRENFLKRTNKVPKVFKDMYKSIVKCQENVEAGILKVQAANKTSQFHQREFIRNENLLITLEEDLKFAKQAQKDAESILKEDVCVAKSFKSSSDLKKILEIKGIQFDVSLPLIDNVRLNADIKVQNKYSSSIPFVYSLKNDDDVSLQAFSHKILVSTLCQSKRKRRSLDERPIGDDLTFKPWYIDDNATPSVAKMSCVTLERTTELLRDTVKKLNTKSNYANDLLMQLQFSSNRLNQALKNSFVVSTGVVSKTNDIIKANEALLMSANNELNELQQQVSVAHVLDTWQKEAEIVTGFNNASTCLNYEDCVQNAIETLGKLPTMFSTPRSRYMQELGELESNFKKMYTEQNLIGISTTAQSIERSISYLKSISLHCTEPPKVSLIGATDRNVKKGSSVTLRCKVSSSLPVTYHWKHDETILDGENTNALKIEVSEETNGFYSCVANSFVGNGTSAQVKLTSIEAPKFIEEPEDTVFNIPSNDKQQLSLTCNVTDYPQTTIAWYFKSLNENYPPEILKSQNKPILLIDNPNIKKIGHYFCQGFNKYGRTKSREARVDILPLKPADLQVTISFNIPSVDKETLESIKKITNKMLAEITSVERNIGVKVTAASNSFKITLVLNVYPSKGKFVSSSDIFRLSSKSRQEIANAAAVFVATLAKNKFEIELSNKKVVMVDNETLTFNHKLDVCPAGYKMHKNGFTCVPCSYGSAGLGCKTCPINTYADELGLSSCKKCGNGEITELDGSTRKSQCLSIRSRKTDIIFAVDASTKFLQQTNVLPDIKKFIADFVKQFDGGIDTRYGLLTYYKYVDVYLTLNEFMFNDDLLSLLDILDEGTSSKDASLALQEARTMFEEDSTDGQKKILIMFTNGFSQGDYSGSGFVRAKSQAVALQDMGVHTIAIGSGNVDYAELTAIASYPKKDNVFPYSIFNALTQTLKSIDGLLSGKCFTPSIDFGILVEGVEQRSTAQLAKDVSSITNLLTPLHKTYHTQSYLFIDRISGHQTFASYNEANFKTKIQTYVKSQTMTFDVYQRIKDAEFTDLTEIQRSSAKIKFLIVVTKLPLDESRLKGLEISSYGENIVVVNFALDSSTIERTEGPLSTKQRAGRLAYGFDEVEALLQLVKNKKDSKICL